MNVLPVSVNNKVSLVASEFRSFAKQFHIIISRFCYFVIYIKNAFRHGCVSYMKTSHVLSVLKTFTKKLGTFHKLMKLRRFNETNRSLLEEQPFDGKHDFQKTQILENSPSKNQSSSLTARNKK